MPGQGEGVGAKKHPSEESWKQAKELDTKTEKPGSTLLKNSTRSK